MNNRQTFHNKLLTWLQLSSEYFEYSIILFKKDNDYLNSIFCIVVLKNIVIVVWLSCLSNSSLVCKSFDFYIFSQFGPAKYNLSRLLLLSCPWKIDFMHMWERKNLFSDCFTAVKRGILCKFTQVYGATSQRISHFWVTNVLKFKILILKIYWSRLKLFLVHEMLLEHQES